mgnify:CR=1 FL=1
MNIDTFTLFSYLSIRDNILYPLDKFMSKSEIDLVCQRMTFKKSFFSLPFFLCANENDLKTITNNKLKLIYNHKKIGEVTVKSISMLEKDKIIESLFKDIEINPKKHPYVKYLMNSGNYIIETESFSKKKFKLKIKNMTGFATRNIPHKGHEKIIKHFCQKRKVLINIFEDSSNNKKINSLNTFKAYNKFIDKNNLKKKIQLKKIKLPSFLLGPRQAAIHAIVAKNLTCNSFIVGRDHSGFKNFFDIFQSYSFCKKNEKKIGIKIYESGSPVYCFDCNKIVFRKNFKCRRFIDISASLIRKNKNNKIKKLLSNF